MKYLREYTEEATSKALDKAGAFFAFSNEQAAEKVKPGVKYGSLGAGLICPVDTAKQLTIDLDNAITAGIAADLAENGRKGVIHRELGNHEYSYNQDPEDTIGALACYGITADEVLAETGPYMEAYYKWEEEMERKAAAKKVKR